MYGMTNAHRNERVFQAIAHPVRRRILEELMKGEKPTSGLAAPFKISLPAVSQHLSVLKEAHLVSERRVGRQRIYQLHPRPLKEVFEWVEFFEQFWLEKLDALGEYLRNTHGNHKS